MLLEFLIEIAHAFCFRFIIKILTFPYQISEVYSKELKGAISALASLQGHLLIASGTKITLNKWTGSELVGVAFYDAPLHVVSLNIVRIIQNLIFI